MSNVGGVGSGRSFGLSSSKSSGSIAGSDDSNDYHGGGKGIRLY